MVFFRQTDAIVGDFQVQGVVEPEAEAAGAGLRVAYDVGKGFLGDAVGGYLDRCRQLWEMVRGLKRHLHAIRPSVGAVLSSLFTKSPDEPEFIESGRAQCVDQAADIGDDSTQVGAPCRHEGGSLRRVLWDQRSYRSCLQVEGSQCGSQAIVQVATQAATLLLACRHEPLACSLQFGSEAHGVSGYACLARQIIKQAAVGRCERFSPGARSKQQLADGLSLVD